jgi:hypothetical protein
MNKYDGGGGTIVENMTDFGSMKISSEWVIWSLIREYDEFRWYENVKWVTWSLIRCFLCCEV